MASNELKHLHPAARALAMLGDAERIEALKRERWIDYPRATEALACLHRLLTTPQRHRMPCLVMHGHSDIGKTLIIAKFVREHPPLFDDLRGVEREQVIEMQMPATPDQFRFYRALLARLGAPQSPRATLGTLEQTACDILKRISPRMLIVDEIHHLLAGSHLELRSALNLLKYLANELKFSVIAVGTNDAPMAFGADPQMSSRFTPFEIRPWTESDEFRRLLHAFEQVIPLRKSSDLQQRSTVQFLIAVSQGLLGRVSRILNMAAEYAILDSSERMTIAHLERAAHAIG